MSGNFMSTNYLAKSAIVICDGVFGLVGAQALSEYFEDVIVLEPEQIPSAKRTTGGVTGVSLASERFCGSCSLLCDLFPGFLSSLWEGKERACPVPRTGRGSSGLEDVLRCTPATASSVSETRTLLETVICR
jgi:hypothetical protein